MTYKERLDMKKAKLEADYVRLETREDFEKAYEILGILMRYKFITKNDDRLSEEYYKRVWKQIGRTRKERFPMDVRTKETSYVRDWVYGYIPPVFPFRIDTLAHKGKRVEGVYEGEIEIESQELSMTIREIKEMLPAKKAFDSIVKIYKLENNKSISPRIVNDILNGKVRLYKVSVDSNCPSKYKCLGYMLIRFDEERNKTSVQIVLDNLKVIANFISVSEIYHKLKSVLQRELSKVKLPSEVIEILYFCDLKKYGKPAGSIGI